MKYFYYTTIIFKKFPASNVSGNNFEALPLSAVRMRVTTLIYSKRKTCQNIIYMYILSIYVFLC